MAKGRGFTCRSTAAIKHRYWPRTCASASRAGLLFRRCSAAVRLARAAGRSSGGVARLGLGTTEMASIASAVVRTPALCCTPATSPSDPLRSGQINANGEFNTIFHVQGPALPAGSRMRSGISTQRHEGFASTPSGPGHSGFHRGCCWLVGLNAARASARRWQQLICACSIAPSSRAGAVRLVEHPLNISSSRTSFSPNLVPIRQWCRLPGHDHWSARCV